MRLAARCELGAVLLAAVWESDSGAGWEVERVADGFEVERFSAVSAASLGAESALVVCEVDLDRVSDTVGEVMGVLRALFLRLEFVLLCS